MEGVTLGALHLPGVGMHDQQGQQLPVGVTDVHAGVSLKGRAVGGLQDRPGGLVGLHAQVRGGQVQGAQLIAQPRGRAGLPADQALFHVRARLIVGDGASVAAGQVAPGGAQQGVPGGDVPLAAGGHGEGRVGLRGGDPREFQGDAAAGFHAAQGGGVQFAAVLGVGHGDAPVRAGVRGRDGLAVQERALAHHAREQFVGFRGVHDAQHGLSAHGEADADAVVRQARGVLAGAVDGVHDPHAVVVQAGAVVGFLLAEQAVVGKGGGQGGHDQRGGLAVGDRDGIVGAGLVFHRESGAQVRLQQRPGLAGHPGGDREFMGEIVGSGHAPEHSGP